MKKSIALAAIAAAMMSLSTLAPAQAGVVTPGAVAPIAETGNGLVEEVGSRRRRRHLGYAAGLITLGVIGAIAADRAHSRPRRHHYRPRGRNMCRVWRNRCHRGNDRACWKFDTRC